MTRLIRCPICEQAFDPAKSTSLPFCCERCRRIDLGRWLRERYGLPVERDEESDDGPNCSDPAE